MLNPSEKRIFEELAKIKGGYNYYGACSCQICFPLKAGGELRFSITDDEPDHIGIDLYDGAIPAGVSGPAYPTG
jgi:hypothetical protein